MDMAAGGNCTARDHWVGYLEAARPEGGVQLLRVGGGPRGLAFVAGEGNVQHNPPTIRRCTLLSDANAVCPQA
jgi:hypothetical protein